jgi:YidC/Oxa1 family membrane protein insertase
MDRPGRLGVDGALGMAGFRLQPGETAARSFQIYCGPREYRRLRELGNYEAEIMDFGIFGIVSKTLLNSMNTLNGWFGSYAWAIVVLTIFIKLLMWPLQNKATASMKKMQALQPKMVELREKYKDDPQAMNVEVMKMYKQYGVNPFGGCLPMLIQIPIFFGFYNMLGKAVELRNSKFFWVQDLSQPDTIFEIPGVGFPVNVLPLLMAATMLWSMMLQPKSGDQMQQRIFMFMPLIFIAFCYNFASALALYWTVQNLFSVAQLYVTRNQTAPTLQKVAAPKSKR